MDAYYSIILIAILMMPFLYIFMSLLSIVHRYIREYNRSRVLKFAQEEVKSIRIKIDNLRIRRMSDQDAEILSLVFHFNEMAIGINEGLYDEIYVKMSLGYEMMYYYGIYRSHKPFQSFENMELECRLKEKEVFLPLELLLKKWDNSGGPVNRF